MSNWLKLLLLAAGVAGAWFAATRESEAPETRRSARLPVEHELGPAERGALEPAGWVTPESEALDEDTAG